MTRAMDKAEAARAVHEMLFGTPPEPGEFGLHWENAIFPHGSPVLINHDPSTATAVVSYDGVERTLEARFEEGRALPDRVTVQGLAARFKTGRVLWDTAVAFWSLGNGTWEHRQTHLFDAPRSKGPATVVGFLQDFPARQRGTGGLRRMIEDRARAGQPDGPANAAEVGREWERSR